MVFRRVFKYASFVEQYEDLNEKSCLAIFFGGKTEFHHKRQLSTDREVVGMHPLMEKRSWGRAPPKLPFGAAPPQWLVDT